ncbi:hypothetical protein V9T40_012479 [Parthenolecanium corni]|uniref:Uncharacterized protein n=1 Tax=Parthenolecanium corni TaxID=536013 RepID=A0AAN9T7C4_9HEMI
MTNICRLCANIKEHVFQIFDEEGYKLALSIKINKYLQIQVDEKDSLPKNVCWECFTKLEECTNFVNDSQNAQLTLAHKIFSVFDNEDSTDSLKGEHVFSDETIFEQASNLLSFSTETDLVDKNADAADSFECDDLDFGDTGNNCFYDDKSTDCLFEERNRNEEHTDVSALNTVGFNKRKSVIPVRYLINNSSPARTKRKLGRKTKICVSKKKKIDFADEDDFSESESDVFKEKYFKDLPWICTSCEEKFERLNELQNHHINYHLQPPRYMCPHCYKIYMQYHGFVTHLKKFQCNVDFQCENCPKIFPNKKLLDMHRRIHVENPPFQCSTCDKSFKQPSGLYAHARSHLPEDLRKGHACDQCDKCFSSKPNLITHKKIHMGLKNHTCDLCGKGFVQRGNLNAHMLTHSDNKPFTCEVCQKEFKTHMQLRKHKDIHTGKKPHQCDICGRTFRERGTLREHYRIHTGAMPFTCEFCGKAFRFKGVLTTHRRQHTGERPYSCLECQHHFTNWPNYNKHMKRRHGINKSKTNRIKSDNIPQNNSVRDENVNQAERSGIELPSFEDTLQSVSLDNDKVVRLFGETPLESSLLSQEEFSDAVISQQNSILNAYYSISVLQPTNSNQQVDLLTSNVHRLLKMNQTTLIQIWKIALPELLHEEKTEIEFYTKIIEPGIWLVKSPLGGELQGTVLESDGKSYLLIVYCGYHKKNSAHFMTLAMSRSHIVTPQQRLHFMSLLVKHGYDPYQNRIVNWSDC